MPKALLILLSITAALLQDVSFAQNSDYTVIARVSIAGNRKTQESIILRELTFQSGDTISKNNFNAVLSRSKSNLVNTLLFNYVDIVSYPVDSVYTDIIVHLKERFYLWPIPVFQFADPNFNTWWLNKDFSRTNYGLVVLKKNFRGRNEDLGAKIQLGYSKEFAATYRIPYLTKKQNLGGGIWASYVQNNEITVGTFNNKRLFYTGITGNSRDELSLRLNLSFRGKFYSMNNAELRFNHTRILDTITHQVNNYLQDNSTEMKYLALYYTFKFDKRDNKGYPLTGHYTQVDLVKQGIANIGIHSPNVLHLTLTRNDFFQLAEHLFFATQFKVKTTPTKDLPYFFQEGLGYTNYIRGYEYYVIDGQHFGLFKSNFKYRIFGPKVHDIEMLKNTNFAKVHYAFYLNLYIDAGYVVDKRYYAVNPLSNNLLYGTGLGLDFVSFYDKVIRFEYSLNKELEHGFFLHFIKPI